jgi:hypothetical protein
MGVNYDPTAELSEHGHYINEEVIDQFAPIDFSLPQEVIGVVKEEDRFLSTIGDCLA